MLVFYLTRREHWHYWYYYCAKMAQNEIKKMKQGMSYSGKEKTIILNVFKYLGHIFPDKCITQLVRMTSKATGCSEKSIFQFRKEEKAGKFKEPSKTKIRKNPNINSRDIKYNGEMRQVIRSIVYDLKYRNIVPSLSTILRQVNEDERLPNFSLMTLRRLLFEMGFYYEKEGNKSVLLDKNADKNRGPAVSHSSIPPPSQEGSSSSNSSGIIENNQSTFMPVQNAVNPLDNLPYKYNLEQMSQNVPANQQSIVPDHMHAMPEQNQRTLTIHVSAQEHLQMPPPPVHPPHNMAMFNNPREYPGYVPQQHLNLNMDMHYKCDFPHAPWVPLPNQLAKKD